MKSLTESYSSLMMRYDSDRKIARYMRIFEAVLNNKFGRKIPIYEEEAGAGASRLWQFFEEGKPFIQITAFKGCKEDEKTNLRNNAKLFSRLRSYGLGVVHVIGNDFCKTLPNGEPDPNSMVKEPGFFASFSDKYEGSKIHSGEQLKRLGLDLCNEFGQWGYLYGDEDSVTSFSNDGKPFKTMSRMQFLDSRQKNLDKFWTEIKGHKYTFTESIQPDGPLQGQLWIDIFKD